MNIPLGKSIFLWNTPLVLGGAPTAIAAKLREGQFDSVILKVANGNQKHFVNIGSVIRPKWIEAVTRETVRVLQAQGLKVFGYGFNYGNDVAGEAHIAVSQCLALKLDGYVFDAEGRFEGHPGADAAARVLGGIFRAALPDMPAIFCGFARYVSAKGTTWHPKAMFEAFMEWCDAGMPMCYWEGSLATTAIALLEQSIAQWRAIAGGKPIYPAGRAYIGDNGKPTAEAMIAFDERLRELELPGESWWSLEHILKLDPSLWAALCSMPRRLAVSTETTPAPVSFLQLPEARRWELVELALKQQSILDAAGVPIEA